MNEGCCGAGKEQRIGHKKIHKELVNEHYKEPVNGLLDDVTTSGLKALASDEPV